MNCHAYLPLFPIPLSAVDRIYRRIERQKVVHDEQREVLTAIAAVQVMIRSPVMESGVFLLSSDPPTPVRVGRVGRGSGEGR